MEIIGCGIEDHASHWVDVTNNSCWVSFCPKCGQPLSYASPNASATVRVKIQVTQSTSYGDTTYYVHASYEEDDEMLFVGHEFVSPEWAVKSAKEKAINYHFRGTRFEWEVWLDVAVITRSNARQPAYEK